LIGIGIIGYGYWGPKVARNFSGLDDARLVAISDLDPAHLSQAARNHPSALTTTDYQELLQHPDVDAIAIATPVSTHFSLAMAALKAGKHLWVEKPLTDSVEQAVKLVDEANRLGLVLMVDHTFVYTGAVRKIKEMVDSGELGDLHFYDSARVNLGLFQHDVDVLWDLAVHDLAIMKYLLSKEPTMVSATGMDHIPGHRENVGYLTLFFDDTMIAHIHVNWLAPVKIRRTLISGTKKMIVYDDLEPSEKVKVYDKGVIVEDDKDTLYAQVSGYRTGDMWAPHLDMTEALLDEAKHFVHCIRSGEKPITDGEAGLYVVRILEAATASMKLQGQPVKIAGG